MPVKLLIVFNALIAGLGVFLAVQLGGLSTSMDTLTQRVTDLEVQNVQLSRQLEWVEQKRTQRSLARASTQINTPRTSGALRHKEITGTSNDSANVGDTPAAEMTELKEELRQEVADIVAEEQSESRKQRRQEWETRMRESMTRSLDHFAEDHGLDDDVKTQVADLIDESMNRRGELREEMNSRNLSFYEFREKERELSEEMDDKLSELLTEDQMEVFQERFPMGPRRRGPGGRRR